MVVGSGFLLLERVVVTSPAVTSVCTGRCKSHVIGGQSGLTVGWCQGITKQFCCVKSTSGAMGTSTAVYRGSIGNLTVSLGIISQVMMGVGVARKGSVAGAPGLEGTSTTCWT